MNKEFFEALEALSKEKSIPRETLAEKIEAALISAYKKDSGGLINARVKMDFDKKELKLYRQLTVVDAVEDDKTEISLEQARQKSKKYSVGDLYEIEVKTKEFGRISAQAAKSVIVQAIRTAEREKLEREYEEKKESIVSAVVEVVDPVTGNAVLELGKNRMTIFRNDQIPGESYVPGDRIKVYVTEVRRGMRGPSVSLSRVHPGLVKRLFELEVPEVAQGVVEIKAIAREPGSRTKIAVASNDPNVDPIGTCIGPRGARKNAVTNELNGEKIDIIKYSENNEEFIAAALAPATVKEVIKLPEGDRTYRVIVDEDQLSLAIGREGQNARLAASLTGLKIDIKSGSLPAPEEEQE